MTTPPARHTERRSRAMRVRRERAWPADTIGSVEGGGGPDSVMRSRRGLVGIPAGQQHERVHDRLLEGGLVGRVAPDPRVAADPERDSPNPDRTTSPARGEVRTPPARHDDTGPRR